MAKTVKCQKINDELILVNFKEVRQDMDGNWVTKKEMTPTEKQFFNEFLQTIEHVNAKTVKAEYSLG